MEKKLLRKNIIVELKEKLSKEKFRIFTRGGFGKGRYVEFVWIDIGVLKYNSRWRIALFLNDIDQKTGNAHSTFEQISFQRDLTQKYPTSCYSPNEFNYQTENWEYRPERIIQSREYVKKCNVSSLVDEFIEKLDKAGILT